MKKFIIAVLMLFVLLSSIYAEKVYRLPTTIVSADRNKTSRKNTSYHVQIITAKRIKELGFTELPQIIDYSSNVISSDNGYSGSVSRISMRGGFSRHITVMIDGVPINSSFNGSPDLSVIPVDAIKRVEIVEGPISAMYGSGSISGVVNIITKSNGKNSFSISLENRNAYNASASVFSPLGYLSFSLSNDRSWRSNTDFNRGNFLWKKDISLNPIKLSLSALYTEFSLGVPGPMPDSSFIPEFGDSTANSLYDHQNVRSFLLKSRLNYTFLSKNMIRLNYSIHFDSLLYYSQYRSWYDNSVQHSFSRYYTITNFPELLYFYSSKLFDFGLGGNLDMQSNLSRNDIYGDTNILADSSSWKVKYNTYSTFQEAKLKFIPHMILENKLRYDYVSLKKDTIARRFSALSYDFGGAFNYKMFIFKANYGTAFKNPGLNDLFFPYMGNPNLKPEKSREFSVLFGINLSFADFTVSYFNKNVKDLIYWNGMSPENINSVKVNGVEGKCTISAPFVTFSTNLTYENSISHVLLDTSGTYTDRRTPYSPEFKVSYILNLNLPYGFTIGNSGMFTSPYVNYFGNISGGVDTVSTNNTFITNINIGKKISNLTIKFSVDNILDYKGIKSFGYSKNDRGYPYDGRRIKFGISSAF